MPSNVGLAQLETPGWVQTAASLPQMASPRSHQAWIPVAVEEIGLRSELGGTDLIAVFVPLQKEQNKLF